MPRAASPRLVLLGSVAFALHCGGESTGPGTVHPASVALVSGNNQIDTVGRALAQPLVVRVTASDGSNVPGVAVNWSVTAGGGGVSVGSTTTGAQGQAQVVFTLGTTAGVANQTVRAAVPALGNVAITFNASAIAGAAANLAVSGGTPQNGTVGTALSTPLAARVTDRFGNRVGHVTVAWSVGSGGGTLSAAVVQSDTVGESRVAWTLGPTAGPQTAVATAPGLSGSPLVFTATAMAGAATQLAAVSGDNQSGTVGQALAQPLVVAARDSFGNAVAGAKVYWSATTGSGTLSADSTTTGPQGETQVQWTLGSLAGGPNAVTAGLPGASATAIFHAAAVAGAAAQLVATTGNGQSGTVAQDLAQPLVARVADSYGNPVAGITVQWTTASGTLSASSVLSDTAGLAAVIWTLGTTAGPQSVQAAFTGLAVPTAFSATALPGPLTALVAAGGDGQTGTVGQPLGQPLVVRARDLYDNPLSGIHVGWTVSGGGGSLSADTVVTDAAGRAAVTWTMGTVAGAQSAAASTAGIGVPVGFGAIAGPALAAQLTPVSGDGQSGTVAQTLAQPLLIEVVDVYGNPVPNAAVAWSVTSGGGTVSPATGATDALGRAQTSFTLGTAAGTANHAVAATVAGVATGVVFTASADPGPVASLVSVSGNAQTDTVGRLLAPLVVAVVDTYGNGIAGVEVTWAVTAGAGTLSAAADTSGSDGRANVSWTLDTIAGGPNAVGATTASATPVSFTATAVAGHPLHLLTISGGGQADTVGRLLPLPLVVAVTDTFGNRVAGVSVAWTVTAGTGAVTAATTPTGTNGEASVGFTLGTVAGSAQGVAAAVPGLTGSPAGFSAAALPSHPVALAAVSGDAQVDTVGHTLPLALVVAVTDTFGNPVAGVSVTWTVAQGGGAVSAPATATDGLGQALVTWTLGPTPGAGAVAAGVTGLGGPVSFGATAVPDTPTVLLLSSGDGQTGVVATTLGSPLAVRVEDQGGNGVPGIAVSWIVQTGGGTLVPGGAVTDASGYATAVLTLGTAAGAGNNSVQASSIGIAGSPCTFTASAVPGPVAAISVTGGDGQTGPAGVALPVPYTVRVADAYDNPVSGASVDWAVTAGGGSVSAAATATDAVGHASVTRTLGPSAGSDSARASVTGLADSAYFNATATPNATISGQVALVDSVVTAAPPPAGAPAIAAAPRDASLLAARTITAAALGSKSRTYAAQVPTTWWTGRASASKTQFTTAELVVVYRPQALGVAASGPAPGDAAAVRAAGAAIRARVTAAAAAAGGRFQVTGVSPAVMMARLQVRDPADVEAVAATLRDNPAVAAVARTAVMHTDAAPNDPLYAYTAWNYGMIDLPRAWAITTGSASVLVAVVDDGTRFDHPDLAANLTNDGRDFVSSTAVSLCGGGTVDNAGDGDGYDADPTIPAAWGYNSGGACATAPSTLGGHGLHVAGTIGAVGNDGLGINGVNWSVRIRPVRVLGVTGLGTSYDVAQGILYAAGLPADDGAGGTVQAATGARVINLSLSSATSTPDLQAAVQQAAAAGALLVAAAGNTGTSTPQYPAAYPEVVSVSAVGPDGLLASYSSFGSTVDLAAPGGDFADGGGDITYGVYSTGWDFSGNAPAHFALQGTSMAAPHVTGVAALLLAQNAALTAADLRQRLTAYAVDAGAPGPDAEYGAGIVNARNALTQSLAPARRLFVRLLREETGVTVATLQAAADGSYTFATLDDGPYLVFAGEDENGDGRIGVPGRRWGAFGGAANPQIILVDGAGTYGTSFTSGLPGELEPNDGTESAMTLPVGGYFLGQIASLDLDVYRVRIPTAGTYTFETSGWQGACGFGLEDDTLLRLHDGLGNEMTFNDDIDVLKLNYCSRITATLAAGTYYLSVQGFNQLRYRIEARAGS